VTADKQTENRTRFIHARERADTLKVVIHNNKSHTKVLIAVGKISCFPLEYQVSSYKFTSSFELWYETASLLHSNPRQLLRAPKCAHFFL